MPLYPLLFHPIHKKMIWGSESWDISCRHNPGEMGIIENGPLAGTAFDEAISADPLALLGTRAYEIYKKRGFPLLVKIIAANDDLSVQVHPDDDYAAAHGFESGKSEMWYIIEAPEGQSLIIGLKDDATPEKLRNDPLSCLKRLPIKKGDIINIPAGLVHAITNGVVLAEVQQNSDVTFRLYDYGRLGPDGKPRELHQDHGIAAADFQPVRSSDRLDQFNVAKQEVAGSLTESSDPKSFTIYTCVEGSCTINEVPLTNKRSVFIPATLGPYTITGTAILLKSSV